ncbi:hypothetical protein PybrP1_005342 [[Pythium] brassicae (nom. inval.)]|nr:hypothetical protein PybrP1_005342 [[Pythium] brassicae (nom. inval.)]
MTLDAAAAPPPTADARARDAASTHSNNNSSSSSSIGIEAAATDPNGAALFDYSSYTGGAPSLLSAASGAAAEGAGDTAGIGTVAATASLFTQELDVASQELIAGAGAAGTAGAGAAGAGASSAASAAKALDVDERRIGRPNHPAWEHFVRGEKRNRFHHNAYCRYCAAHGVAPEPIRGVSENMIRHLQKCLYCPEEIVAQLKILCAQKDAERFSKRHQAHPSDVDLLLHDSSPVPPSKRAKRGSARAAAGVHPIPLPADVADSSAGGGAAASPRGASTAPGGDEAHRRHSTDDDDDDEFMPLQLPLLSHDTPRQRATGAFTSRPSGGAASASRPGTAHARARLPSAPAKCADATSDASRSTDGHSRDQEPPLLQSSNPMSAALLNRLVQSATLAGSLPWDWMWMDESARLFGDLHAQLAPPRASSLRAIAAAAHAQHFAALKDELVGVTLAISTWVSKYQKTSFALFSLVNALGEASAWDLLDLGLEEPAADVLADKIKRVLLALQDESVQVINIVADAAHSFAAARFAVSALEHSHHDIPVLPCFSQFLSLLLGAVLTVSDVDADTMGDVIEIVQTFSNQRALRVLRRECGDPDAALVLPTKDSWYSFIECIDSVRQYEDMIKIIAAKVLAAAASSAPSAMATGGGTEFPGAGVGVSAVAARPVRKDSAGNSMEELADTHLSPSVLRAISSPEFWENVVSLSELMSPIKETHKVMTSGAGAPFSLSDVFYQFGRMHQQYGSIVSDWEDNTLGSRRTTLEHVRFLQATVNKMWRLYDQPLMCLSYALNYTLVHPHQSLSHPSLQWLSVGKNAKEYFRRWFCAAPPLRGPSPRLPLGEDAAARFLDDILAYKERKYPFDSESVCEFENPRAFYLLVSDSNPLMHLFGARLFSFATSTPRLAGVVPGSSFLTSASSTVCPRAALLPVLQMKLFAHTKVRPSKDVLTFLQQHGKPKPSSESESESGVLAGVLRPPAVSGRHKEDPPIACGMDPRACATVWNKKQWARLASEWRAHWEKETDVDELLRNLALLDPALFRFAPNFSLDQIFKDKLPSRLPQDREEAVVDV